MRRNRKGIITLKMKHHLILVAITPSFRSYSLCTECITLSKYQNTINQYRQTNKDQNNTGCIIQHWYKKTEQVQNHRPTCDVVGNPVKIKRLAKKFYDRTKKHFLMLTPI